MAFPLINPILQFFDNSGEVLSGGLLYTYAPGTTTPKTTYSDENLSVANANPIVLDSAGRCTIFLTDGEEYKFILQTAAGVTIRTVDEVKSPAAMTAELVGAALFPRTEAEESASVTPTSYAIPSHNAVGYINPARYGTNTTPGTTNVTTALKNAIAVAQAISGGAAIRIAGKWFVNDELLITSEGVWLEGYGKFTDCIIGDSAMTTPIVRIEDVSGPPTGIRNLGVIFESGGNVNEDCIHLDNCNGTFIENVWLNGGRYGLNVGAGCDDCHITNVISELCYSANFYCTGISGDIKYSNCLSHLGAANGWYFLTSATSLTGTQHHRPVYLSNCSDLSSNTNGFVFEDFNDVVLSNVSAGSYNEGEPVEGFRFDGCTRILGTVKAFHTELYGISIVGSTDIDLRIMVDAVGDYASITAAASYGVLVNNSTRVNLTGKVLNVAGNGVRYAGTSSGKIHHLDIIDPCQKADSTNGLNGLYISDTSNVQIDNVNVNGSSETSSVALLIEDTPTVKVTNSHFQDFPTLLSNAGGITITGWRNNTGIVTENSGTGTIASGATTAVVNHGLSVTPTLKDISIVFGEQGTNDYGRWSVGTITSTQFTLTVASDPGASNLDFAWRAAVL